MPGCQAGKSPGLPYAGTVFIWLILATAFTAPAATGFLEYPVVQDDFTDALPVVLGEEGSTLKDVMLLDFGARPLGANISSLRYGHRSRRIVGSLGMIASVKAEPRFRKFINDSIDQLTAYLGVVSSDMHARTVLGVRFYQNDQIDKAIAQLGEAHRLDPDDKRISELYSGILMQRDEELLPADVAEKIRRILDVLPENEIVRFNLACALSCSGQAEAAMDQLEILQRMNWPDLVYYINDPDLINAGASPRFIPWQDALVKGFYNRIDGMLAPVFVSSDL